MGADAAVDDDGRETGGGAVLRSSRGRLGGEDGEGERKESLPRTASKSLMLRELPMSVEAQRARERADMSRPSGVRLRGGESVRARATSSRPRTLSSKSV